MGTQSANDRGTLAQKQTAADPSELPDRAPSPFGFDYSVNVVLADYAAINFSEPDVVQSEGRAARYGQLLVSAILNGALLDDRLWNVWLSQIGANIKFREQMWLDLQYPEAALPGVNGNNRWRRWFPDPLTQMLIVRWHKVHKEDRLMPPPDAAECIRSYDAHFTRLDRLHGMTLQEVLELARLKWNMAMPAVLVDLAAGDGPSISLPPRRWERLVKAEPLHFRKTPLAMAAPGEAVSFGKKGGSATRTVPDKLPEEGPLTPDPDGALYRMKVLLKRSRKFRSADEIELLKQQVETIRAEQGIPRTTYYALDYVYERVGKGKIKPNLLPESLLKHLESLEATILRMMDPAEDILDLPAEDLAEFYSGLLEDCFGSGLEGHLAAISGFQKYVELKKPSLRISFENAWGRVDPSAVDANLISSADYKRILSRFPAAKKAKTAAGERSGQICRLLVMLGFRAGLRIGEATGLLLGDMRWDHDVLELRVDHNHHRLVKSRSSRRVIPLDALLTNAEADELKGWYKKRLKEEEDRALGKSCLLFCGENEPDERMSGNVTRTINAVMKDVTGDQTCIYHHLRHSFASYLLATLLLPPDLLHLPILKSLDEDALSRARKERVSLRLLGENRIGRSAVHAVSTVLGHAGVETTLQVYCHLLDWVIGLYASRAFLAPQMDEEKAKALTGQELDQSVKKYFNRHRREYRLGLPASPSLRLLDEKGHFETNILKPGTGYSHILLRRALKTWGVPASRLNPSAPATSQAPITWSKSGRTLRGPRPGSDPKGKAVGTEAEVMALRYDRDLATKLLIELRWPDGIKCPWCEEARDFENKHDRASGAATKLRTWHCRPCNKKFSVISGTAMQGGTRSFGDWVYALYLMATATAGVTRADIKREVTGNNNAADFIYRGIWHAVQHTGLSRFCVAEAAKPRRSPKNSTTMVDSHDESLNGVRPEGQPGSASNGQGVPKSIWFKGGIDFEQLIRMFLTASSEGRPSRGRGACSSPH